MFFFFQSFGHSQKLLQNICFKSSDFMSNTSYQQRKQPQSNFLHFEHTRIMIVEPINWQNECDKLSLLRKELCIITPNTYICTYIIESWIFRNI